ncbi:hypothetical protein [Brachyspira pilosicoli]|uniref:DUF3806 domain-containing protein n=1 Tax=Brachyspira pilosicoli TaxID=52584 RepID=A0A5C8F5K7_BRAPL|nr:hypothetical protein [Brachyspira pilosicoli]TXJ44928.1 hypothetical protein EPJ72_03015 [Brachyspira pilosicoli]
MSKYTLPENDIIRTANWISNFLIREGYHIDYTIQSLKEIDKFFKEKINKILENDDNNRNFIFAIAAYIGEVIKMHFDGKWNISREVDLDDEAIGIYFKNHAAIYPLNITLELIQKQYTLEQYIKENFNTDI